MKLTRAERDLYRGKYRNWPVAIAHVGGGKPWIHSIGTTKGPTFKTRKLAIEDAKRIIDEHIEEQVEQYLHRTGGVIAPGRAVEVTT